MITCETCHAPLETTGPITINGDYGANGAKVVFTWKEGRPVLHAAHCAAHKCKHFGWVCPAYTDRVYATRPGVSYRLTAPLEVSFFEGARLVSTHTLEAGTAVRDLEAPHDFVQNGAEHQDGENHPWSGEYLDPSGNWYRFHSYARPACLQAEP